MLGRSRWGEEVLPRVLTLPWLWRLACIVLCTRKKNPDLPLQPQKLRGRSCRGPEQHLYDTPFPNGKGIPPPAGRQQEAGGFTFMEQPPGESVAIHAANPARPPPLR